MASVKYSGIITELKGSIGGVTFQKCGSSLSVRSNPNHKIPMSSRALSSRSGFAALSNYWRNLSDAQRLSWSTYAPQYPYYDRFGTRIVLSAYQLFMAINRPLFTGTGSGRLLCSPYVAPSLLVGVLGSCDLSSQVCYFTYSGVFPPNHAVFLYVSVPFSLSIPRTSKKTIFCYVFNPGDDSGKNIYTMLSNTLGSSLAPNSQLYYEFWSLTYESCVMLLSSSGFLNIVP